MPSTTKISPWSLSTTLRSPDRLRDFLKVAADMEGQIWTKSAQMEYQSRLIQKRMYGAGAGRAQFYKNLPDEDIQVLESGEEITLERAQSIFNRKRYTDAPMRGRTSIKMFEKFGYVKFDICSEGKKLKITEAGQSFLEANEIDSQGNLVLSSLLKWQLPNSLDKIGFPSKRGYNIRPFLGVLHLLKAVNGLCEEQGLQGKGISITELGLFGLTLIDWRAVQRSAADVIEFREAIKGTNLNTREGQAKRKNLMEKMRPDFNLKQIDAYADNVVRYFRFAGFIAVKGVDENTYARIRAYTRVDFPDTRKIEIYDVIKNNSAEPIHFDTDLDYINFLTSKKPFYQMAKNKEFYVKSILNLLPNQDESHLEQKDDEDLACMYEEAQDQKRYFENENRKGDLGNHIVVKSHNDSLRSLGEKKKSKNYSLVLSEPLQLEWLVSIAIEALNDAVCVRPNFTLGDDGLPRTTAGGNKPDIVCEYENFAAICEVTMQHATASQAITEGASVVRHFQNFSIENEGKSVCIFLAPSLHRDTLWSFRNEAIRGVAQGSMLVPMTINQFCNVIDYCIKCLCEGKHMTKEKIYSLYEMIGKDFINYSGGEDEIYAGDPKMWPEIWGKQIDSMIEEWGGSV